MDWLSLLRQFLLDVTYGNLWPGGLRMNILGVLWAAALIIVAARRFSWQFSSVQDWPRPAGRFRGYLWVVAIVLFAIIAVFLFQIIVDDFITVPIQLAFGSWSILVPGRGGFTLLKLIAFKWDNYSVVILISALFYLCGIWRFCHFTKASLFWLSVTVAFVAVQSYYHVFSFMQLSGDARITAFWIGYPWFRIITGFLFASLIKKRGELLK
jgi:hypothetical protein